MPKGYKIWVWTGLSNFSEMISCTLVPESNKFTIYNRSGNLLIDGSTPTEYSIRLQAENIILRRVDSRPLYKNKKRLSLNFLNIYGDAVADNPDGVDCSQDSESTGNEMLSAGLGAGSPALAPVAVASAVSILKKQAKEAKIANSVYDILAASGCAALGKTNLIKNQLVIAAIALGLIPVVSGISALMLTFNINVAILIFVDVLLIFLGVYQLVRYISR